jgi:phosphoribosylpyrophosphate synthetase
MKAPLIFSTAAYDYLAKEIAVQSGWDLGTVVRKSFPDGEHYQRIETAAADRDVVLVGGTVTERDTMEFYDLACGMVAEGAYRLRLVIPWSVRCVRAKLSQPKTARACCRRFLPRVEAPRCSCSTYMCRPWRTILKAAFGRFMCMANPW